MTESSPSAAGGSRRARWISALAIASGVVLAILGFSLSGWLDLLGIVIVAATITMNFWYAFVRARREGEAVAPSLWRGFRTAFWFLFGLR